MIRPLPRGVAVALVTLFRPDGEVDVEATAAHAARLVELGVRGVLVAGSTGEADTLTDGERVALVAGVRRSCPDVPIIAGASGAWSRPAAARAAGAIEAGADAVLVAPPRRCADLSGYYAAVAAAVPAGAVLAYHYPGLAGGEVPVEALAELPIGGIKDSTVDPERLLAEVGWGGATYVGSTVLTGYAGHLGAAGAILAVANVAPEECAAAFDGDHAAQRRLLVTHRAARQRFPLGLKELLAQRFGTSVHSRLG
ncbi:MAG: dihydrodipicolinate synthase family protein [Actinobacteria bacterium]|nr:dihydrodipicolinate synthase family protein [Actinomycetota bacterium]